MLDIFQENPYIILLIPVFLFSLSIHEFAHALAANFAGDMLATYKGRLTLNPIAHIDLIGTIIVPLVMLMNGGMFFGWAKPVPVNPHRYDKPWWEIIVSGAGPASNLLLVFIFWIVLVFLLAFDLLKYDQRDVAWTLIQMFIHMNVLLTFFNLLPIPPIDGSHIIIYLIRDKEWGPKVAEMMHRFGFMAFILFLLTPLSGYFFMFTGIVTGLVIRAAILVAG